MHFKIVWIYNLKIKIISQIRGKKLNISGYIITEFDEKS